MSAQSMTIRGVIAELEKASPEVPVRFDFVNCVPTHIASSRGSYNKPALGWTPSGYSGDGKAPSAYELIQRLTDATDGREYEGWKGGLYTYSMDDVLCVDNWGDYTDTLIVDVRDIGHEVILITRWGAA